MLQPPAPFPPCRRGSRLRLLPAGCFGSRRLDRQCLASARSARRRARSDAPRRDDARSRSAIGVRKPWFSGQRGQRPRLHEGASATARPLADRARHFGRDRRLEHRLRRTASSGTTRPRPSRRRPSARTCSSTSTATARASRSAAVNTAAALRGHPVSGRLRRSSPGPRPPRPSAMSSDRESAMWSRDALEDLLTAVAKIAERRAHPHRRAQHGHAADARDPAHAARLGRRERDVAHRRGRARRARHRLRPLRPRRRAARPRREEDHGDQRHQRPRARGVEPPRRRRPARRRGRARAARSARRPRRRRLRVRRRPHQPRPLPVEPGSPAGGEAGDRARAGA